MDDDEWEICNEDGFVFKRRRRRPPDEPTTAGVPPVSDIHPAGNPEAELQRHRRARKRQCLLNLRERYSKELEQWEGLSSALLHSPPSPPPAAGIGDPLTPTSPPTEVRLGAQNPVVDELLFQVDAHEAILRKLSELCNFVELKCNESEESLAQSLLDLPIWGSPRSLISSLSD